MTRQTLRKTLLLLSFSAFPITVIYLAPAPPLMSLRQGGILPVFSLFPVLCCIMGIMATPHFRQ